MLKSLRRNLKQAVLRRAARRFRVEDSIVICGSPRSGTTWLTEVVAELPQTAIIFEPLHLKQVPEAEAAGFNWRSYLAADGDWSDGRQFLAEALTGKRLNSWTLSQTNLKTFMAARSLVVKFVRANRLMPWLMQTFKPKGSAVIYRHPGATVASRLSHTKWAPPGRPVTAGFLEAYPQYEEVISRLEHPDEFVAAQWAMDNLVTLGHQNQSWVTVQYEDLVLEPAPQFRGLLRAWGFEVPEGFPRNARVASSMTRKGDAPATDASTLSKWKAKLTPDVIDRVFNVAREFGFEPESETDYFGTHAGPHLRFPETIES